MKIFILALLLPIQTMAFVPYTKKAKGTPTVTPTPTYAVTVTPFPTMTPVWTPTPRALPWKKPKKTK